ncbi:MAG TPA: hypothetical protein VK772_03500 [Puia sp.]|nr:hypothetical protein [Puia sp.]
MKKLKTIAIAGFISGLLDATAAILFYTKPHNLHNISMLFRSIAKGLLGKAAFSPGIIYPVIGLILHFLISNIWAAFYLAILSSAFKSGFLLAKIVLFAAIIWITMNGFVMPVFGYSGAHYDGWSIMRSFLILVFCVSVPIIVITEKRNF